MSWVVELQRNGTFEVANEVNHRLYHGAFPPSIPHEARMQILNLIAEAPAMLVMLKGVLGEVDNLISGYVSEVGSDEAAREAAPGLFMMRELIDAQIKKAEGMVDA